MSPQRGTVPELAGIGGTDRCLNPEGECEQTMRKTHGVSIAAVLPMVSISYQERPLEEKQDETVVKPIKTEFQYVLRSGAANHLFLR